MHPHLHNLIHPKDKKFWVSMDAGDKLVILYGVIDAKPKRTVVPITKCFNNSVREEAELRALDRLNVGFEIKKEVEVDKSLYLDAEIVPGNRTQLFKAIELLHHAGLESRNVENDEITWTLPDCTIAITITNLVCHIKNRSDLTLDIVSLLSKWPGLTTVNLVYAGEKNQDDAIRNRALPTTGPLLEMAKCLGLFQPLLDVHQLKQSRVIPALAF